MSLSALADEVIQGSAFDLEVTCNFGINASSYTTKTCHHHQYRTGPTPAMSEAIYESLLPLEDGFMNEVLPQYT